MLPVFLLVRPSCFVNGHTPDLHHGLQTAFGAEAVQLIRVGPTVVLEQQLGVFPVAAPSIEEISNVRHFLLVSLWCRGFRLPVACGCDEPDACPRDDSVPSRYRAEFSLTQGPSERQVRRGRASYWFPWYG